MHLKVYALHRELLLANHAAFSKMCCVSDGHPFLLSVKFIQTKTKHFSPIGPRLGLFLCYSQLIHIYQRTSKKKRVLPQVYL